MRVISFLSVKTLVAGGAVAATLGAGVVAAHAAYTVDDFGQAVKQEDTACKASEARLGWDGIGQCVSAWVLAHEPSPEPSESPEATESPSVRPSESPEADDAAEAGDQEARPSPLPTPDVTSISGGHSGRR